MSSKEELERMDEDIADEAVAKLIPDKSKDRYLLVYKQFVAWRSARQITTMTERTFLSYFGALSKDKAPSTLWSIYSMLKKTLRVKENFEINQYSSVVDLLKVLSKGFNSKKAKVLSPQDVDKFLNEAPDEIHLATKVVLIFGVQGACRRSELVEMTVQDVKDKGSMYLITLPKTKTYVQRTFVVEGKWYELAKKYAALRPENMPGDRFFVNFQKGKCCKQFIGLQKVGAMPKMIAKYLKLDDPELYTGHCFRRTSATVLADSGASLTTLKRHGGWKRNQVAEGYIEDSVENKRRIGKRISDSIISSSSTTAKQTKDLVVASTSKAVSSNCEKENTHTSTVSSLEKAYHFVNCQNITLHIHNDRQ